MPVWKPDLSGRHHTLNAGTLADVDAAVDRVEAASTDEMREDLGATMHEAGVEQHRGWVLEYRVPRAWAVDAAKAAQWLRERGMVMARGRHGKQALGKLLQAWLQAHGEDWPSSDVLGRDIVWTARRK